MIIVLLSFVVLRKLIWRYFAPNSSFKIVCSCVFIVCSSLKINADTNTTTNYLKARFRRKIFPHWFSRNYRRKNFNSKQLRTILKLGLGGKWFHVRFRGTRNEKIDVQTTTNMVETRFRSKIYPRWFSRKCNRWKQNYKRFWTSSSTSSWFSRNYKQKNEITNNYKL